MRTLGNVVGLIVLVGTLPAIGILNLWWLVLPLTLAMMVGVPLVALWPWPFKPFEVYRSDQPAPFDDF